MAMNFWLAQSEAKRRTAWMVAAFIFLTFLVAALAEYAMETFWLDYQNPDLPYFALLFIGATFLVALFNYTMYQSQGGSYVAETIGAVLVNPNTNDPKLRQLVNIIDEIALATTLPRPAIYVLKNDQINAFAAGLTPESACICVNTGTLDRLNRDELQAVIAHEFGHIYNRDMRLSMRLSAMLMGFFFIFYIAFRIFQFAPRGDKKVNPILLVAIVLTIAGIFSYFAGKILSAMVSRQREYLADASSVQFTRNPEAMIGALKKIQTESETTKMPASGMAFTHMYLDYRTAFNLFATHPPIEKRIAAIEGNK